MSVKKEKSGRRSIQVEIEVPGTPEEVWRAIATGAGISSWFVPTEVEEREGGVLTCHFGPGMDMAATITGWDPPHRFTAENPPMDPNAPVMATEWIVEARDGGTCVVRVVHSLFASSDDWDDQLEGTESGWPAWFRILKIYMTHFRGQTCSSTQAMSFAPEPAEKAWKSLKDSLGLSDVKVGQKWSSPDNVRQTSGTVDFISDGPHYGIFLILNEPAPGVAFLMASAMGGQVYVGLHVFFYGDRAANAAAESKSPWQDWMSRQFPMG